MEDAFLELFSHSSICSKWLDQFEVGLALFQCQVLCGINLDLRMAAYQKLFIILKEMIEF